MKSILVGALALTPLLITPLLAMDKESAKRLDESAAVFSEVMATPDRGIPQEMLENAHCIVIVPGLKTAAFIVGGKYGKGYLSCRNKSGPGWSAPGTVRIEGGSVGFQIGGSETDLIMLVMNERGADKLLSSKFTLGAEGSVAAGPVGRTATAQTDAQMHAEILSWSRSQGLFAGLALEGATLRQDLDDNATLYGRKLENREIVTKGVRAPKAAEKLARVAEQVLFSRAHENRLTRDEEQNRENNMKTVCGVLVAVGVLWAQEPQAPNPTQQSNTVENAARMAAGSLPIYRVTVVERTTKAVNYRSRGGATKIDFRGTPLLAKAHGEAKVESKQGYIEIEVEFRELQPATAYGTEYLTYVMWAVTPEGRATNLGEVLLNGTNSKLDVTTELQSFGMIVTAEPYFAVTQPSDVVVMENVIRPDTRGTIEQVDAKYELLKRGQYTLNVNPADIKPAQLDRKVPLELYEARNAVQIARWTGAERYSAETFQKAVVGLENAEGYLKGKVGKKPIATVAREAVQMAEDSRIITVKKIAEEQLANKRQAGVDREARAESGRAAAQSEAERIGRNAEGARIAAQLEAESVRRQHDAQTAAARQETDRVKRESDARLLAAQAETDRARQEKETLAATAEAQADRVKRDNEAQLASAQAETDRLTRENEAQRAAAKADLDRANSEKAQGEADKAQLRAQLLLQFNTILQTRDTARGLIVNMSDVLFDTAKFSLRPAAREKLARVAGILSGHPSLKMQIEGHTDSVGTDDYNQGLSEHRAGSVRDYLTGAGIPSDSVTARGFGKTQPVASNNTSAGRQQNRRVELVISGEIIGADIRPSPFVAVR